ncbi:type IA DNA topoisomerase [Microvirga tunisiensis]|uniref:DNA topoisomerase n=1 Tax=Microvirga tunisiensis TaxID=2108360 RepID=A0A5N7MB68_9HYPH|nr:DNA topoisomerase [Microvirga tunisiensis]MPR05680.1 DNA topoisomerase [Microvirga tunisiensis]MPR23880.1 DNA topoisomerase [Microvirga tunisiensis]
MTAAASSRTVFFFEKPSAMRKLQQMFRSPTTVCVSAEGHLLATKEPGDIKDEWKTWAFDTLPIVLDRIPVTYGSNRSGQSHKPKVDGIKQALNGVSRVIVATDPGREGSMIAWEVLEFLGYRGPVDRLKLGALDDVSIKRAFAQMAKEPDSGERDYAAYLEALCRQYEDYHLGLNGTRAISLKLRPQAFRQPWRFGGVQTPTLAILADLEARIRKFVPQDYYKIALKASSASGALVTLWHAPKDKILDKQIAETIRQAASSWSGPLKVEQKDVNRAPPKLFSKDTLARRCAKRFGWDPQKTAQLAQELYDQGFLTYPRTESEHLPESQMGDAPIVIESVVQILSDLAHLLPDPSKLIFRKGNKGHYIADPGEHHAIVPLRKAPQRQQITHEQFQLWELVAKSFMAAHLPDGVDARTTISAQIPTPLGDKRFTVTGSVMKSPGWRAVYGTEAEEDTDNVPGKAKGDDDPSVGRLPPVTNGENANVSEARIETAKTEPPRRITRGELPVVMGRLVDQIDDPKLKAALENPANPNEPKGLGTAATRDAILPKLIKSQYVTLLKGKDPPLQVTEVGMAFIDAVRRVFPSYADPVGRALFESELAEIGRATSRTDAMRRAAAFQERTRTRLKELIETISKADAVALDPSKVPPAGAGKPPTPAMVAFATKLAAQKGLPLPRGLKTNSAVCRAFLDQHAPPRPEQANPQQGSQQTGPRAPSDAMLRYANSLAQQKQIEVPPEALTDFAACKAFIDKHATQRTPGPQTKAATPQRASRSPIPAGSAKGATGTRSKASPMQRGNTATKAPTARRSPPR